MPIISTTFSAARRRSRSLRLSVLAVCLWAGAAHAKPDYTVDIDAPANLAQLLRNNLELVAGQQDADIDQGWLDELVKEAPDEAKKLLDTEGYFHAKVSAKLENGNQVKIKVEPGEPVLIDDVTIRLVGSIREQADYQQRFAQALEAWALPMGAPFRQEDWDASKRAVLRKVQADSFPRARMTASEARIDPASGKATLDVTVDSGALIRFGDIQVKGMSRYPSDLANGLADFNPGSAYNQQKLLDYQSALEQSPYFSSVIVSPDFDHLADNRVPVAVDVVELPRQKLESGLTYDSDVGPGVRLGYDHYNIFQRGYTGSMLVDWKREQQSLSLGLGFPRQADGYSHSITSSFKSETVQGLKTDTVDAGLWRIRSRGNIESRLGVEFLKESEEAGGVTSRDTHVSQLVYGWTQRAVDDPMRPRSGYLLDARLSGSLGMLGSSTSIIRGYGRAVGYWSPFPKYGTFVGRIELGQVWAKDGAEVPSALLFRAGGANSVRGYDYQSLGLPGPNGSVLGGRVVATGSVEYQIPIKPDWRFALFSDAGNAADSWKGFQTMRAYGVGVRWLSPVAPLSFDIAKGENDGKLRWNLSLGLAF
ncbi:autotransporter assembly complex family protein [Chromobacterium sp. IIBBL 290-4]|uniref:autotransporter assembly complex protein TamA n=1 Tax=Chromobacterium sp. IIBBL 290-4 TaxID=2953890 RepID=UPI0020B7B8B3|nr:autotransporter assembly complex family protein [Chromobacterium sp. IIBBL 290-4]UTH76226.1 autotransporter assembly complex protein TamA [Chromobacterium sp. IIBBL 290-4]